MLVRIVLAVEDSVERKRFERLLSQQDAIVDTVDQVEDLWGTVSRESYDIVVAERSFLGAAALETVASLRDLPDSPEVIVLCQRELPEERAAMLGAGCLSVLNIGLEDTSLDEALSTLLQRRMDAADEILTQPEPSHTSQLSSFITTSPAMQTFMDIVHRVVASDATLLIMGETGVGKEKLARAIHAESPRSAAPFIAVNCGALSESLLESELFGHEEGAFTGASRARRGWFELAHNGTLFLDEIGEMPKHLQVKLLTVLQTRELQRVGAENSISIDVRVVAATNRDLLAEIEESKFRRDLYYRLSVVSLTIPPLRERKEDIPRLVEDMLEHFQTEIPYHIDQVSPGAMKALCRYDWPGNVRELMNVIERAMLLSTDDIISLEDLPVNISGVNAGLETQLPAPEVMEEERLNIPKAWLELPLREARESLLSEFERSYLTAQLENTHGRIGETAKRAGIQPRSLFEKMKRLGLRKEAFRGKKGR